MDFSSRRRKIFMRRNWDAVLAYVILLVLLVPFALSQNDFFTRYGPQSIFNQVVTLAIAALAQTLVILTAGIDISLGALIALCNSIAGQYMEPMTRLTGSVPMGVVLTCLVVLCAGGICGLFNGLIIVYGRLQPIVVTLATASIFTGIALYIRPIPGGNVPEGFCDLLTGTVLTYVPVSAIVIVAAIVLFWVPLRKSRLGQAIFAVGGNESAAFFIGINVNRTKILVYFMAGCVAATAAILLTAQTASGDPLGGSLFSLNSIAAVVLGGTAFSGGKGGYIGSVAGAFIFSLILGLLIFWNVPSFYQNAVQGLVLLAALAIGVLRHTRNASRALSVPQ
jgi:ribose transport system permease protein